MPAFIFCKDAQFARLLNLKIMNVIIGFSLFIASLICFYLAAWYMTDRHKKTSNKKPVSRIQYPESSNR